MKRLDELFEIKNSQSLELINCEEEENGINFISRTSVNNGTSARIKKLDNVEPMPENALTVALGGSVLSTFYQDKPFYTAFHIACLYPKSNLNTQQMLYYAYVIEANKYKYSYGRQANRTLSDLLLPSIEEIPSFVSDDIFRNKFDETPINKSLQLNTEDWELFDIAEIFNLEKCKCSNATEFLENGNDIAYIGAKKNDNGIMKYVQLVPDLVTKGNCIVFIGDGQGSVGFTTYQPHNFIGSTTLTAGYSPFLNEFNAQFLITILDMERYRYSFGRKYGHTVVKKAKIKLPATKDSKPDWLFMENYIKGLPYSKCL